MTKTTTAQTVPAEQNFALNKVKMIKDGGLDVHYDVTEAIDGASYTNKFHVESAKDVHPDLINLFERLRPIMGRIFNLTSFLSMIEAKEYKATDAQQAQARAFAQECMNNIEVRGVSLSGQGDNVGVVLTGLFTVSNNQKTAINSPRLKYATETFGFEEELEQIVADIEREVYEFLFKGKKAQLELFGDNMMTEAVEIEQETYENAVMEEFEGDDE